KQVALDDHDVGFVAAHVVARDFEGAFRNVGGDDGDVLIFGGFAGDGDGNGAAARAKIEHRIALLHGGDGLLHQNFRFGTGDEHALVDLDGIAVKFGVADDVPK